GEVGRFGRRRHSLARSAVRSADLARECRSRGLAGSGGRLVLDGGVGDGRARQDEVELAARALQERDGGLRLGVGARAGDLVDRRGDRLDGCAQLTPRAPAATCRVGERVAELGRVLRDVRGARFGERRETTPAVGRELDEPLVLEQVQSRVDRARARAPLALAALGDLLDDLVAVHGLLGEEQQDGGADVAAPGAPGAATAAPVTTTAVTRTEAGPAGAEPRSARTEAGPAGAE